METSSISILLFLLLPKISPFEMEEIEELANRIDGMPYQLIRKKALADNKAGLNCIMRAFFYMTATQTREELKDCANCHVRFSGCLRRIS